MPDPSQQQNVVDPKQVLLALLSRANRNMATPGAPNPGGATPPFFPTNTSPNGPTQVPGGAPAPQQTAPPTQQPQAPRPVSQLPPMPQQSPFEGTFGNRQGIISQIVNAAEKRSHDKKVNEAEMYYNQINSFLAAGQQEDAHRLLDDPKVRKVLKAGLDYQPLTEEPPPEALGINKAQQKISQKQNMLQKIQQMIMPRPQQPPGRSVIPGPSQQATQAQQLEQAKIGAAQAEAGKYTAEAGEYQARTAALGPEAEAKKLAAQAEADRATAELKRAESEAKKTEALTPFQEREYNAKIDQLAALKREADAHARYFDKGGKLPGSAMQNLIKSARSDLYSAWKDAQSTKNTFHKAIQNQESTTTKKFFSEKLGWTGDARIGVGEADKQFTGLTNALKWWDGEGLQKIQNGEISPSQALAQAYKIAGIEAPPPSNPSDPGDVGGFVMQPDGTYVER